MSWLLSAALMLGAGLSACGSDKSDEPGEGDEPSGPAEPVLMTAGEMAGSWTLVKDLVLYSETDSSKEDETVDYSGNSYPKYKFYEVSVSEEEVVNWQEVSVSGYPISDPLTFTLDGNNLVEEEGNRIGKVTGYNLNHSWDNLSISWLPGYSTVANTPVISTYMKD